MLSKEKEDRKTARIDLRIPTSQKEIFERAARAKGLTLTSYIISTVSMDARETVERSHRISLTNKTARIFLEALEAEPNERLIEAAKRFEASDR